MKKIFVFIISLIIANSIVAQTSLTYKDNALFAGDSVISKIFNYVSPGNAGANQIWDFSKIQFTGKTQNIFIGSTSLLTHNGVGNFNIVLNENDKENYFNITEDNLEFMGYTSKDISLVNTNPVIRMKYPFNYGDNLNNGFSGNALYKNVTPITFDGQYTVIADAYGTLVLPETTVNGVLRVKVIRNVVEQNPCSTTDVTDTNYYWYAQGYRYPLITITNQEVKNHTQEPVVTRTAYYNLKQPGSTTAITTEQNPTDDAGIAVLSYPNPFNEKINYSYFLRNSMNVTIELYSVSGTLCSVNTNNQLQSEGLHTGEIDAAKLSLLPGIYYMRFTFNKNVIIQKIVKL